jgi:hypothetical protein
MAFSASSDSKKAHVVFSGLTAKNPIGYVRSISKFPIDLSNFVTKKSHKNANKNAKIKMF